MQLQVTESLLCDILTLSPQSQPYSPNSSCMPGMMFLKLHPPMSSQDQAEAQKGRPWAASHISCIVLQPRQQGLRTINQRGRRVCTAHAAGQSLGFAGTLRLTQKEVSPAKPGCTVRIFGEEGGSIETRQSKLLEICQKYASNPRRYPIMQFRRRGSTTSRPALPSLKDL